MTTPMIHTTTALLVLCAVLSAAGCSHGQDSDEVNTQGTKSTDAPIIVRGTVESVSATEVTLKGDSATITVKLVQPVSFFTRVPSDLSKVKASTFIGVTTVKQPDGSERATEIHLFPEALRGLGEGSRMMTPDTSVRRMTNGNVSAQQSRMSNGSISSTDGTTLVVQYAGGSQTVTVPPNTPVTELAATTKALAVGDQVAVVARKQPDGTLTGDKVISTAK